MHDRRKATILGTKRTALALSLCCGCPCCVPSVIQPYRIPISIYLSASVQDVPVLRGFKPSEAWVPFGAYGESRSRVPVASRGRDLRRVAKRFGFAGDTPVPCESAFSGARFVGWGWNWRGHSSKLQVTGHNRLSTTVLIPAHQIHIPTSDSTVHTKSKQ